MYFSIVTPKEARGRVLEFVFEIRPHIKTHVEDTKVHGGQVCWHGGKATSLLGQWGGRRGHKGHVGCSWLWGAVVRLLQLERGWPVSSTPSRFHHDCEKQKMAGDKHLCVREQNSMFANYSHKNDESTQMSFLAFGLTNIQLKGSHQKKWTSLLTDNFVVQR